MNRLWPAITRDGARVVSVSSNGHQLSDIHWDDVHFEHGYDKWQAYGQAKTANALFALHLDTLGRDAGVRAFSLHPGTIRTQLARHMSQEELAELTATMEDSPTNDGWRTPEQGAATQVWAATSPQLDDGGGVYCEDCDIAEPSHPHLDPALIKSPRGSSGRPMDDEVIPLSVKDAGQDVALLSVPVKGTATAQVAVPGYSRS